MANIKYEIRENIGTVSESSQASKNELNLISWNERESKYDIKVWSSENEKMSKGITLTKEELRKLRDALNEMKL